MDTQPSGTIHLLLEKKLPQDFRKRDVDYLSLEAAQHEMNFWRGSETVIHVILCNQTASRNPLYHVRLSKYSLVQEHHPGSNMGSPSDSSQPGAEVTWPGQWTYEGRNSPRESSQLEQGSLLPTKLWQFLNPDCKLESLEVPFKTSWSPGCT